MRSREQFKAYVYAKAEAAQAKGRKRRRLMFSGIAACSVCICVVSAVFLMPCGGLGKYADRAETAPEFVMGETNAVMAERKDFLKDPDTANDIYGAYPEAADDTAGAGGTAEKSAALKSCLFSVNTGNAMVSNSLVRAAYCEILDDTSDGGDRTEDADSKADVRVAVTAYHLKKPDVSNITVSYAGDAVTITVFADAEPIPFGSYVYYFTETLDDKKYLGQPIQLEFKLTSERNTAKNTK